MTVHLVLPSRFVGRGASRLWLNRQLRVAGVDVAGLRRGGARAWVNGPAVTVDWSKVAACAPGAADELVRLLLVELGARSLTCVGPDPRTTRFLSASANRRMVHDRLVFGSPQAVLSPVLVRPAC